ncbi:MAG: precorrin-2 C(20)-methyltransferase, partial [Lachnospiraceae bacterium]|nr:precorrin-2 C(20)-methyltransferase [Lachnospiraceae bacterium]
DYGVVQDTGERGMRGTVYGVGVGPGDPELMTIKARNAIISADVIACPEKNGKPGIAFVIAEKAVPEISSKELLLISLPMEKESRTKEDAHRAAAKEIESLLEKGKTVAFLTLGDPSMYSTASYVFSEITKDRYHIEMISGIPSFCAASSKLLISLASGNAPVLITTAENADFSFPGSLVIMKTGSHLLTIKNKLSESGRKAYLVENCGLPNERVYEGIDSFPEECGYFSTAIVL